MSPEKMQFFSLRDFHNTAKLHLIWEQTLSSGREWGMLWAASFQGQHNCTGTVSTSKQGWLGSVPRAADSSGAYPV